MSISNEISISFNIFSDSVPPSAITATLGISSDKEGIKGTVMRGNIRRKFNRWSISATASDAADIRQQVSAIINRLKPLKDKLLDLADACAFELSCVVYVHNGPSGPGIHFGIDELQFLVSIGAEIDVDFYSLNGDPANA